MTTPGEIRRRVLEAEQRLSPPTPRATPSMLDDNKRVDEIMREQPALTLREAWLVMFNERY